MKLFQSENSYVHANNCYKEILTPLGHVSLELNIDDNCYTNLAKISECFTLHNGGTLLCYKHQHFIAELVICKPDYKIPNHMKVEKVIAGIWRIKPLVENLNCKFDTKLIPINLKETVCGSNNGVNLDAISFEYEEFKMTIGTQDGNTLLNRLHEKDMMANEFNRLEQEFPDNIIQYNKDYTGLSVPLTSLVRNEVTQIHFVIAWNYALDEFDCSTWFAVDLSSKAILSGEDLI
ncbi:hypothetical protein [Gottfriedia acidiceleris]|uniref:hypothetical protein n=1 Tax=Gottfriedia acidiceleris TaxID=371036 RepID=UPI00101C33D0|nr:hypothetical protein [Gottfriedia acidiceleris]